ncbi:MAG: DNA repair protein RecO [Desulfobacterales bacterium]|nr:DNA repair protein RecO [Desulfobacterales bacterium]
MSSISTAGILLRRIEYGDHDLILTLLTQDYGKISMIAKFARKSRKRFPGTLELFSEITLVGVSPRKGGMPVLQEAALKQPFAGIRGNLLKTAYASYWSELVLTWLEEQKAQKNIYRLLRYCLGALDAGQPPAVTSIVFQLYFLQFSGLSPNLRQCGRCRGALEKLPGEKFGFDLEKGGLVCKGCLTGKTPEWQLSRGTVKQLLWIQAGNLKNIRRLRFTEPAIKESQMFLEAFIPYHLGREPKSLKFLNHIRQLGS